MVEEEGDSGWGPLSGQIMSTFKEGCRRAFQQQPQRLVTAMYSCEIAGKAEALGRMYGVISRRRGQVVKEDLVEGSSTFTVTAHIPVFSHWAVLDVDPYWIP